MDLPLLPVTDDSDSDETLKRIKPYLELMAELNQKMIDSFKSIAGQNSVIHPDGQIQDFLSPDSSEKTRISLTLAETLLLKVTGEQVSPRRETPVLVRRCTCEVVAPCLLAPEWRNLRVAVDRSPPQDGHSEKPS